MADLLTKNLDTVNHALIIRFIVCYHDAPSLGNKLSYRRQTDVWGPKCHPTWIRYQ